MVTLEQRHPEVEENQINRQSDNHEVSAGHLTNRVNLWSGVTICNCWLWYLIMERLEPEQRRRMSREKFQTKEADGWTIWKAASPGPSLSCSSNVRSSSSSIPSLAAATCNYPRKYYDSIIVSFVAEARLNLINLIFTVEACDK